MNTLAVIESMETLHAPTASLARQLAKEVDKISRSAPIIKNNEDSIEFRWWQEGSASKCLSFIITSKRIDYLKIWGTNDDQFSEGENPSKREVKVLIKWFES